jgi:hypothetical protein
MNTRTVRMFSAMAVAVLLLFVGNVIWSHTGTTANGALPSETHAPAYAISLDQASVIAKDTAPYAALTGAPALVSYQGTEAYAVPMDVGMIYVQANTGRVLLNTMAVAVGGAQQN